MKKLFFAFLLVSCATQPLDGADPLLPPPAATVEAVPECVCPPVVTCPQPPDLGGIDMSTPLFIGTLTGNLLDHSASATPVILVPAVTQQTLIEDITAAMVTSDTLAGEIGVYLSDGDGGTPILVGWYPIGASSSTTHAGARLSLNLGLPVGKTLWVACNAAHNGGGSVDIHYTALGGVLR